MLILHMKSTCRPILARTDHLVERKTTRSSLDPQFLRVRNDIGDCCLSHNNMRWVGNKDLEKFRALFAWGGGKYPSISSCTSCSFAPIVCFVCVSLLEDSNVLWSNYGSFCLLRFDFFFVEYVTSNISRLTISIDLQFLIYFVCECPLNIDTCKDISCWKLTCLIYLFLFFWNGFEWCMELRCYGTQWRVVELWFGIVV